MPWGARSQHTATNLHTPRWSLSLPKEGAGRVESSTSPTPSFPLCAHPGKCHISLCPRLLEVLGCALEWLACGLKCGLSGLLPSGDS